MKTKPISPEAEKAGRQFVAALIVIEGKGYKDVMEHIRRLLAQEACAANSNNGSAAAKMLGVTRQWVSKWLRRSGVERAVVLKEIA